MTAAGPRRFQNVALDGRFPSGIGERHRRSTLCEVGYVDVYSIIRRTPLMCALHPQDNFAG